MSASPDLRPADSHTDDSFVHGGPFYRAQRALGMIRSTRWDPSRRVAVLVAIAWLPLVMLTLFLNPFGLTSLLRDYRVNARLLIAVPVLVLGELIMDARFRMVLNHLRKSGILSPPDREYMDRVSASLVRLRDAFWPEVIIFSLLVIHTVAAYKSLVDATPWLGHGSGDAFHLSAAAWYAIVISAPLFQFLLGLALWRWVSWTIFAFKLSRRPLNLFATHPDEHGGLGFLGLTSAAFAPIAFSATAVIAATWRQDILHHGAHLVNYRWPTIALLAIVALVASGPLVFFVPRLSALRRAGILEYGILGQLHSAEFHEKWIRHRAGHESEFLQAPESTTLANYGHAYERIESLNVFPADKGALYTLAAAVAIPALPAILAEIPVTVVLRDLLGALR